MKRQPEYRQSRRLYRARNGMVFGVCKGLATYLDMNLWAMRVIAVMLLIFTGFWPMILVYVVAGLMMKLEPVMDFESEAEAEFYNSYTGSRTLALHRLKETYDRLDRRIQRMESIVTAREYDWDRRLSE